MSTVALPHPWGPHSHGVIVRIDEVPPILGPIISLDIETNEEDVFVGGAIYDGTSNLYYHTDPVVFRQQVANRKIVGFNVKADLNWLRLMGSLIASSAIHSDPMIQAYVVNSNRASHSLKDVAKDTIGWTWPTYKEMVGKGRHKQTLDKQDIATVAQYCGMDALAAWHLDAHFDKTFNKAERNLYDTIELPLYKLLWDMETQGIALDQTALNLLDTELYDGYTKLLDKLHLQDPDWNPNSPKQTLMLLNKSGVNVECTDKSALAPFKGFPLVDNLLAYKKLKKLHSTYIIPFRDRTQIHTTFNQVSFQSDGDLHGIRTGRLSSSAPNLQNIPAKREGETYGEKVRSLFVPSTGKVFIDADYSQIEYRLLSHYSQEPELIKGFNAGLDVHDVTGKLLGCSRQLGKTLNFAAIYGAQADKIAATAGITVTEADTFLQSYWERLPGVRDWVASVKLLALGRGGVTTMSGRFVPLSEIKSRNRWKRMHAERAAVNYIIQGSAADIIKVAMLNLKAKGYIPVLQVHDELLFETNPLTAASDLVIIKQVMENVIKLSVPLTANVSVGKNWNEAKG